MIDAEEAAQESADTVFGDFTIDFVETCSSWPIGNVSAEFREPVNSNVPALILSGDVDPITPPWHANVVAESFTNEVHLVFSGMGHGNLANRCTSNLFKDFIQSGSIEGLDTSCADGIEPPPFFVDFSGPRP